MCSDRCLAAPAGTAKPTYLELVELQTRGVPAARSANCQALLEQVDIVVAEAEAWLSKATRRIAKGRGSHSLEGLLDHMGTSVRSAQVQMEAQLRKVQVSPADCCVELGCRTGFLYNMQLRKVDGAYGWWNHGHMWAGRGRGMYSCMTCLISRQ